MAKRALYVSAVLVLVALGIIAILRFGYEPVPVKVMKPSYFDTAESVGETLYRRFYSPIEVYKVVVLGIAPQPDFHREIATGFLKAAAAQNKSFEVLITDAQMPPLDLAGVPAMEVIEVPLNTHTQGEFIDKLREAKAKGKRTLIYTASIFSTHVLPGNVVDRYEKATGERLFSISTAPLALHPSQEYLVEPPCVGSERDANGTAPLGCTILKAGRGFYRKKLPQDRFVGIMVAPKPEDYLLMVSSPGQDEKARQKTQSANN